MLMPVLLVLGFAITSLTSHSVPIKVFPGKLLPFSSSQSLPAKRYNPFRLMPLAPGSKLGPYEIVAPLGAGGMGEVYRAHDPRLGREVAIKVLPASFSADPDRLHRFEQEARAAAALNHPNILTVHEIGSHEDRPYLVFELLE